MSTTASGSAETEPREPDYHERFEAERAAGRFVVPWCTACGLRFWHPRKHCPECGSTAIEYVEPDWPATIYTYTVNHRPKQGSTDGDTSVVGYIELEDGLRILSMLEVPTDGEVIGMAVRPKAVSTPDGGVSFVFVPATGA